MKDYHYSQFLNNQLDILTNFIKSNVTSDYVYIDIPLYRNIGDWLIAMGAWKLLKQVSYKCLGRLRWEDYYNNSINPNTIIILQGGGNFGDLIRVATEARNEVVKRYPQNKIIILSQTITYLDESLLKSDAYLYARHSNLYICARDKESYELAKKRFSKNHVFLLPDTSIGLYPYLPKYVEGVKKKTLIMNRRDQEADELFEDKGDVKEWNDILNDIHFNYVFASYKLFRKFRKITKWKVLYKIENWYTIYVLYPFVEKCIPKYFLKYDCVKSTRLHGFLLASMLHLPVEIKDNKFHKLVNYKKTWME